MTYQYLWLRASLLAMRVHVADISGHFCSLNDHIYSSLIQRTRTSTSTDGGMRNVATGCWLPCISHTNRAKDSSTSQDATPFRWAVYFIGRTTGLGAHRQLAASFAPYHVFVCDGQRYAAIQCSRIGLERFRDPPVYTIISWRDQHTRCAPPGVFAIYNREPL